MRLRLGGIRRPESACGRRRAVLLAAMVLAALADAFLPFPAAASWPTTAGADIASYRALRYERVIGQTSWVTCGPAAVATLLTHYFGIPAGERDVIRTVARSSHRGSADIGRVGSSAGFGAYSMLDLKRALGEYGVESAGYRLSEDVLKAYFDQGGLPAIVHLTKPQAHFAVLVGYVGDWLILADPSFGERVMGRRDFVERYGFSGHALIVVPQVEQMQPARERQAETIRDFSRRDVWLRRLGAVL